MSQSGFKTFDIVPSSLGALVMFVFAVFLHTTLKQFPKTYLARILETSNFKYLDVLQPEDL